MTEPSTSTTAPCDGRRPARATRGGDLQSCLSKHAAELGNCGGEGGGRTSCKCNTSFFFCTGLLRPNKGLLLYFCFCRIFWSSYWSFSWQWSDFFITELWKIKVKLCTSVVFSLHSKIKLHIYFMHLSFTHLTFLLRSVYIHSSLPWGNACSEGCCFSSVQEVKYDVVLHPVAERVYCSLIIHWCFRRASAQIITLTNHCSDSDFFITFHQRSTSSACLKNCNCTFNNFFTLHTQQVVGKYKSSTSSMRKGLLILLPRNQTGESTSYLYCVVQIESAANTTTFTSL